ncbi:MAG TPA: HdeD family acid-resistance protein [Caldilineaceae bacterium]|nr:HdeD family acid-resistance protein [Caldilineaceae bacterium]
MLASLSRYWWLLVLRGVVAILFGILAFVWPGLTIGALVLLFGVYALIDGIGSIVTGVAHRHGSDRWWLLLEGVASIAFGLLTFFWPGITAIFLLLLIAGWAVVTGIFEIAAAIRLRKEIEGEWLLGLAGLLSILFGIFMFVQPGAGALALIWVIGSYAILFGLLLIVLGFRVRGSGREIHSEPPYSAQHPAI